MRNMQESKSTLNPKLGASPAKLSKYELSAYFVIWIGGVLYAFYNVYIESKSVAKYLNDKDYFGSIYFHDLKKDATNYEWETYLLLLFEFFPWLILNAILSESLRHFNHYKVIPYFQITTSTLFLYNKFGCSNTLLLFIQPVLFQASSIFNKKIIIWLCAILHYCFVYLLEHYLVEWSPYNYMVLSTMLWIKLRCISFHLDKIEAKSNDHPNFIQFLAYCFYLPLLFTGPFISYPDFRHNYSASKISFEEKFINFAVNIIRYFFWLVFLEILLHFTYISYFSYNEEHVKKMDGWTLYGFGYCMGQFFHIKYVVMYGLSTTWAKLENMDVPKTPKCIGRIHLYSDMWKYFDVGLYKFLFKYIYLPTQTTKSMKAKIFSSTLCFGFVYMWHGQEKLILVWVILNFFGLTVETVTKVFYELYLKDSFVKFVSPEWKRRIFCMAASPLLALCAISNFYFFSNIEIGNIFLRKYLFGTLLSNSILMIFMYSFCQASTEIKIWETSGSITKSK